jgi:hypothetical protein
MNIQIEIIKEFEDGSADAVVHFDSEGLGILVEAGIISILRQYIEQEKIKAIKNSTTINVDGGEITVNKGKNDKKRQKPTKAND